jgi:hypothetical protein
MMAARGVLGGIEPDPDKGRPNRHTRAKAKLMIDSLNDKPGALALALLLLAEKRPEDTLDALIAASGEE